MSEIKVSVSAGAHDRYWAPVGVDLADGNELSSTSGSVYAVDDQGIEYPAQREALPGGGVRVSWLLPHLRTGATKEFTLVTGGETSEGVRLTDRTGEGVDIHVGGEHFTTYQYGREWARPFLYPVVGPAGATCTRHFPMKPDVKGEKHDHPHHKSIFFTHGDVNGVDNWSETPGHGYTRHQSFAALSSGPVHGDLHARNLWVDSEENPYLDQELKLRVYAAPSHVRLFDATVMFHATYGDVLFGDTKEGGLISVRVASSMDASGAGRIETSTGAVGESESWGKSASWCHYSGSVQSLLGGVHVGIGVIDHPLNPRYPTYWHVRNYGLMTANPFGHSYYYKDEGRDGSLRVEAGQSLEFRYRVFIHDGNADDGRMAERFADFAYPLSAALQD